MAGTYSLKDIRVSITLDKGGANNQFVFQGFATNVSLSKTGGVDFATAQVEIYGLTLPVMGQLTEAVRRKPYSVVLFDEIEKATAPVSCL